MSYKQNIVFNYISQFYVTIIGILTFPLYIKYMGAEAYGLIGFFTMLQALFSLLDIGLTPTIARETARYLGGVTSPLNYRKLFRALSFIFLATAILGGGILFILSDNIATQWLNVNKLPTNEVVLAVKIMAICVALRWVCGLYRGVITGSENFVWLSWFNSSIATLRFIMVLPIMMYFGFTPLVFFIHQFVVAFLEFFGLLWKGRLLLPQKNNLSQNIGFSFKPILSVLRFSLTIAFTSALWIFVIQIDKFTLSGILTLDEYGYFTLGILVAGGIMSISGPISKAIMPRMARLYAEGKHEEMIKIYRSSTQIVTVFAGTAAMTMFFCAKPILFLWTGDINLSEKVAPILQLYAINNAILSLIAFPYYLQYAKGDIKYNLIGNFILLLILIPGVIYISPIYGGVGTGYLWVTISILYMFTWLGYVHFKLEPGLHIQWLIKDILAIITPAFLFGCLSFLYDFNLYNRFHNFLYILLISLALLFFTSLSSTVMKTYIKEKTLKKKESIFKKKFFYN